MAKSELTLNELSAAFGRHYRTVYRWVKKYGLPAHMEPNGGRGRYVVNVKEFKKWWSKKS